VKTRCLIAAGLLLASIADLPAADARLRGSRAESRQYCPPPYRSRLASLPFEEIQSQVAYRYSRSLDESERDRTVFNRSPRIVWAYAAQSACGIALGYLSTGEINVDRLRLCECHYARMLN
jgi:hypothetical protein